MLVKFLINNNISNNESAPIKIRTNTRIRHVIYSSDELKKNLSSNDEE